MCQVQISHNTDKKKTHDAELSSDSKTPHIYLKRWRQACLFYPEAAYLIWCYSIVKLTMHCFLCSSQWSWIFSAMFARLASCSPLPFRTRQSNVCPVYIRAFSQAKCKWSAKCFIILGLYTNLRITSICWFFLGCLCLLKCDCFLYSPQSFSLDPMGSPLHTAVSWSKPNAL